MMVDQAVVAGGELVGKAEEMFKRDAVDYVHVHYAGPGCWAVRIDKVADE